MGTNNVGRRKARAEALGRRLSSKPAIYVDAAQESAHTFTIAAVNNESQTVSSRKISAGSIHEAEEASIALGIAASRYSFIISDSMSAIRSYMQGSVGPRASEILSEPAGKVALIWMPAHSGERNGPPNNPPPRNLLRQAPSQEVWDSVLKSTNPQTQAGLADWVAKVAASWTPL
ncbi:hypothetical protein HPB49_020522 [Dermacentor silvarum]|uniref:Uncharacterized protein n=1 Tax=Dermacentor silvarum TaxID=543639 RepID=A0ACB8CMJ8_DERSI|nr:hypothetical protein HPB49_020522 [Dermacentor silvarum]